MAKIIELIETEKTIGLGVEGDPVRRIWQLWSKEGILVFETDSSKGRPKRW